MYALACDLENINLPINTNHGDKDHTSCYIITVRQRIGGGSIANWWNKISKTSTTIITGGAGDEEDLGALIYRESQTQTRKVEVAAASDWSPNDDPHHVSITNTPANNAQNTGDADGIHTFNTASMKRPLISEDTTSSDDKQNDDTQT